MKRVLGILAAIVAVAACGSNAAQTSTSTAPTSTGLGSRPRHPHPTTTTAPGSTTTAAATTTTVATTTTAAATTTTVPPTTTTTVPPTTTTTTVPTSGPFPDGQVTVNGRTTVTTPALTTGAADDLLIGFVSGDGPTSLGQSATVSGGSLTWSRVKAQAAQAGVAEVWQARATGILSSVTFSATLGKSGYDLSLTIVAFSASAGIGASAGASASTGAPSVTVTTTSAGSLVYGAGNDWDRATARTTAAGQQIVSQWVDTAVGDTFWSQATQNRITNAGTAVALDDTAPTTDRFNMAAVEILGAAGSPPPTTTTTSTTSTTSTTVAPTTTTTAAGTTTTTVPATTTTTAPGSDPCLTENNGIAGFPCSANTGVPDGTPLTTIAGLTINTCGTIIDGKHVTGGIDIRATNGQKATDPGFTPCVTIRNSQVDGQIDSSYSTSTACGANPCGPVLISHVDIVHDLADDANTKFTNQKIEYTDERGGRTGFLCDGWCVWDHDYVHDNYFVGTAHMGGTLSNGNSGRTIVLTNSTIRCNVEAGSPGGSGGCSSDINFFGDFGTIQNVTVTGNLLRASDGFYCAYTGASQSAKPNPTGTNLVWRNNVFEKGSSGHCGTSGGGAVADWAANSGNIWCGNTFQDGTTAGLPTPVGCGVGLLVPIGTGLGLAAGAALYFDQLRRRRKRAA